MMRWVGYLISAAGLVLLVVLFLVLRPEPDAPAVVVSQQPDRAEPLQQAAGSPAEPSSVAEVAQPPAVPEVPLVRIEGGHRVAGPAVIQVHQGDQVHVRFLADSEQELHLHGYDLKLALPPGKETALRFDANLSGRFEYELHGHHAGGHAALGVIEVYPQ